MTTTQGVLGAAPVARPAVRRRRSLPGRRAVVGGLLVAVAVVGTFAASSRAERTPADRVLVVRRPVTAGQHLKADDVRVEAATLPDDVVAGSLREPADLTDAVALVALDAGEIVQRSAVLDARTHRWPTCRWRASSPCPSNEIGL